MVRQVILPDKIFLRIDESTLKEFCFSIYKMQVHGLIFQKEHQELLKPLCTFVVHLDTFSQFEEMLRN